jgi:hypothetical protein
LTNAAATGAQTMNEFTALLIGPVSTPPSSAAIAWLAANSHEPGAAVGGLIGFAVGAVIGLMWFARKPLLFIGRQIVRFYVGEPPEHRP